MRNQLRRRAAHRAVLTATVLFLTGTLSGCMAAPVPPNTASPVAEATATETPPVFASNDEALAAATSFYSSYQGMANIIAHEGGVEPQRITPFVTSEMLSGEIASFQRLAESGVHLVGDLGFDSMKIQSVNLSEGSLVVYMCLDVSATDVIDVTGLSTVPPDRVSRHPLEVALIQDPTANRLLLERSEIWTGANFC